LEWRSATENLIHWRNEIIEILFNDIRYAFRMMRKSPGFTLIIILTLALGIGANTSIFSIVNAVLLRSLPYHDSSRLVKITFNNPGIGLRDIRFSVPESEDLKLRAGIFEGVSAAAGDLNQIKRILKLMVLVNSTPAYTEQHLVANGASDERTRRTSARFEERDRSPMGVADNGLEHFLRRQSGERHTEDLQSRVLRLQKGTIQSQFRYRPAIAPCRE
jgi:hypothetical protein